jgi:hypothetical protein
MMKRNILIGLGIIVILFVFYVAYALLTTKKHSPQDVVTYTQGQDKKVEIVYCQPYKKGRLIFGSESEDALVPYGKKWRTGANEATEITFSHDVKVGTEQVSAGTYSVYTIPGKKEWTVVLNSKTDYWGIGFSDVFEEELDVARIQVPTIEMTTELEQFTMKLKEGHHDIEWQLMWDQTMVMVPIRFL